MVTNKLFKTAMKQNSHDYLQTTMRMPMTRLINAILMFSVMTFLLLSASSIHAATQIAASVDRNPVMENESFVLQIVINDSVDSDELDLSPLKQSGLLIGRTSTSSQTQIINGSISKSTTWNVVMLARTAGEYQIPALTFNGSKSQPIAVQVVKSNAQAGQQNQPIFLKNSIENDQLYLQQTTKLVTRLYFAPDVDLQSGTLTDPHLDTAFIKQQGKDNESSEIIMGVRYRVIERVYTVTPQSSGEFSITSPTFNGEISTDRRRSVFSNFGSRKPVTSIGNDIVIKVSPIPENYAGSWLPSDLVQLHEEWQPNKTSYEVGEPITRTFTLTALNVNEEQLPEIKGRYPSEFNMYPDQSESHSAVRQNAVVSQRVSSEAIVANKAGTYTLPEVTLNWFNTQTNRQETAKIPAKTITIVASSSQSDATLVSNIPLQTQNIDAVNGQCPVEPSTPATELSCPQTSTDTNSSWLMSVSGWLLWLVTVLAWLVKTKRSPISKAAQPTDKLASHPFDKAALKKACFANQSDIVRKELLRWAQQVISADIDHLQALIARLEQQSALAREIKTFNQNQYGRQPSSWDGKSLWQAFDQYAANQTKNKQQTTDLPPLN